MPSPEGKNVSYHEVNPQSDPRGNAESPLQSAARQLGGIAVTGGRTQAGQRRILQGHQERDLEIWAKDQACWLIAEEALCQFIKGGEEHRTSRGEKLYHKATYPRCYGFTVICLKGQPTLTRVLPGEYLDRLLLANCLLGDDIRLLGVTRET